MIPLWLASVPRGVWFALAGASLLALGTCAHQRAASSAIEQARKEARADADAQWMQALADARQEAGDWRRKFEAADAELAAEKRRRHNETLARNAAVADALRLRGPGKAAAPHCRSRTDPGVSGGPGGPAAPARPDAPGPDLPTDDRPAVVPWGWLVARAEEHDALLSEVDTWRTWHSEQKARFEKWRAELPDVKFGQ